MSTRGQAAIDLTAERARALKLTPVSRETAVLLDRFVALLLAWQKKTNLIAASTVPKIWTRHVADSLQLLKHFPDASVWIDFGSGGGFPGLPIACALADKPGSVVHLVESNAKKAAFLREAVRTLGVSAVVLHQRAEIFGDRFEERADVVTARALAPLKTLCDQAFTPIEKGAVGAFMKGQDVASELTEAAKYWNIESVQAPSLTSPDGSIVIVRRLTRL